MLRNNIGTRNLSNCRSIAIVLILTLGAVITNAAAAPPKLQPGGGLFGETVLTSDQWKPIGDPTKVRTRLVNINFDMLGGTSPADMVQRGQPAAGQRLTLNLFEDTIYEAVLDHLEFNPSGSYTWIGHLEAVESGQVILVVTEGIMSGQVIISETSYGIRHTGEAVHLVYQVAEEGFAGEGPEVPKETAARSEIPNTAKVVPSNALMDNSIDIMVLYTKDARQGAGGDAAIKSEIDLAITLTNMAFQNSGIGASLNLIHTEEIDYNESGQGVKDRDRLINRTDGHLDNAHTLRNTYTADIVSLIVEDMEYCGVSWTMREPPSTSFEKYAFHVVKRSCSVDNLSYPHELGHNLGGDHDWYVSDVFAFFPFNHGYINMGKGWRTIMAYPNQCQANGAKCPKILHFSNPNVKYQGAATGKPASASNPADNSTVFNNSTLGAARFRLRGNIPYNGGPILYDSYIIDDDNSGTSQGNSDGAVECGEKIEFYTNLRNQNTNTVTGLKATIETDNPYVTITDNKVGFPDIPSGEVNDNGDNFEFTVSSNMEFGQPIEFKLQVTADNGGPWSTSIFVPVFCGGFEVYLPLIVFQ